MNCNIKPILAIGILISNSKIKIQVLAIGISSRQKLKRWSCSLLYEKWLSYMQRHYFPDEIVNIFFEILLPKTKPIVKGIIYRPSTPNFLEIPNKNFRTIGPDGKETYMFCDFDINIYKNDKLI